MKEAKFLLEKLTELVPPGEGQHHNLTLDELEGKLTLTLMCGERYLPFGLEDSDLERPVEDVIMDIYKMYQAVV